MNRINQYVKSTRVRHIISGRVPVVLPRTATITDAIAKMSAERTGCVLIIDPGARLVGILTERDVLTKVLGCGASLTDAVNIHMTKDPVTVSPEDTLLTAIRCMDGGHIRHLPVVDQGRPVAVISVRGLVRQFADLFPAEVLNLPPTQNQVSLEKEGA